MRVWTVKGGRTGEYESLFLERGIIGKGSGKLADLSSVQGRDDIKELLSQAHPEMTEKQRIAHAGQFWALSHRMEPGELVVLPLKTTGTIAVGEIDGPYQCRDDLLPTMKHVRPVKWLTQDTPRDSFHQDLLYSFGAFATIASVKRENADSRIRAVIEGKVPPPTTASDEEDVDDSPDIEALAREQIRTYLSQRFAGHDLARLVGAILEAQGFVVTVSPPGADKGVDILAGSGPLGLDTPKVVVQVKTGQAGFEEFRSLRGLVTSLSADQGLLVAWAGFKGTVRTEARMEYFRMSLWDSEDLIDSLLNIYGRLPDDLRSEVPLQRLWALVPQDETG